MIALLSLLAFGLLPALAAADDGAGGDADSWAGARDQVRRMLTPSPQAGSTASPRVEVVVGTLDPRLRLAPCQQIDAQLPPGARPWGRTRVSLRCVRGPVRWNVYLPVTVKVFGTALVASRALPAGTGLTAQDVRAEEIDLAEDPSPALTRPEAIEGATTAVLLQAGQTVRQRDLRLRQWFAAGETVRIEARGDGFAVSQEGTALTPGFEGQVARIRTDSGKVIAAMPSGQRAVTVAAGP